MQRGKADSKQENPSDEVDGASNIEWVDVSQGNLVQSRIHVEQYCRSSCAHVTPMASQTTPQTQL